MTQTTITRAQPTASARRAGRHRPGLALAIIVTCQLMFILDATVMNVALPRIQAGLSFSPTGLAWVMSAYTLTFGGLLLLGGRAGDILGRRNLFIGGIVVFTLASLAGGFAMSSGWLLAARALQGVGAAAAGPSTIALVATTYTDARARVRALALLAGVASAGFAIGLIVGGVLTEVASWRWVLFINVPFGLAAALLAPRYVPRPPRHRSRLDGPGAVVATAGLGSLVYALIHAASSGWSGAATLVPLAAGVVLLAAFVAIEARTSAPLLPLRLFADRDRAAAYANFLLGPAAMMSTFFFLTQFLQNVLGFGALRTGFAFLPMAAGIFAMSRLVPRLLPRYGVRPLALSGSLSMMGGMVWLSQLDTSSGYVAHVLGPMVLLGLGGGLAFVPLTPTIMSSVDPKDAGVAGGALQTMQQTGTSLGLAIMVAVFGAAAHGSAANSAAANAAGANGADGPGAQEPFVTGMTAAFAAATVFAAASALVALTFSARPRSRRS